MYTVHVRSLSLAPPVRPPSTRPPPSSPSPPPHPPPPHPPVKHRMLRFVQFDYVCSVNPQSSITLRILSNISKNRGKKRNKGKKNKYTSKIEKNTKKIKGKKALAPTSCNKETHYICCQKKQKPNISRRKRTSNRNSKLR